MHCYKIIRSGRHGRLISHIVDGPLQAEYHLGKWTKADPRAMEKGYGLCVFRTLTQCGDYLKSSSGHIFECEIGNMLVLPRLRLSVRNNRRIGFIRFRKIFTLGYIDIEIESDFPSGTIMTDKLKLIRELPR